MKKPLLSILTDTHLKDENIQLNHSIFSQAIEITKSLGLNYILHLGDIFDGRSFQTVSLLKDGFYDILEFFKKEGIKLISITGNHDKTGDDEIHSFLTPFQDHPYFKLIETYETISLNKEIDLYLLSFFKDKTYNGLLKQLVDFSQLKSSPKKKILGTHIGLSGAIMNNGKEVTSDIDNSYISLFEKVLIGHYHDEQQYKNIHYIGSSFPHNFGENNNKGLSIFYDDLSIEKIPLDFPKYTTYNVKVTELKSKDVQDLELEKKDSNIRVLLEGTEEEVKAFNKQELLNLGIKVEKKVPKISKKNVEEQVEKYDKAKLDKYFSEFCNKNLLKETEGIIYLKQI